MQNVKQKQTTNPYLHITNRIGFPAMAEQTLLASQFCGYKKLSALN